MATDRKTPSPTRPGPPAELDRPRKGTAQGFGSRHMADNPYRYQAGEPNRRCGIGQPGLRET